MRKFLGYIILFLPLTVNCQTGILIDTIRIREITVNESPLVSVVSGFRNKKVDSAALNGNSFRNVSDLLSEASTLFIKNYGPSGSATVSFRGTGASHTQLLWNELSLNSPMLGQADLSLVPAGFIDELRIFTGGASMIMGSGGLGGAMNLQTKPEWVKGTAVTAGSGAGSFGRYSGIARVKTGTTGFQAVTRILVNNADNDFPFTNPYLYSEPVAEKRLNAALSQKSVMQEFFIKGRKSVTSAGLWYFMSDRELPSILLVPQQKGSEKQIDESFRAVLSHKGYMQRFGYDAVAAWFSSRLDYTNIPASIDSRNNSNTFVAKASGEVSIDDRTNMRITLNNELDLINSVNYSSLKRRYVASLTASLRRTYGERLGTVFLIREILDDFKALVPDFSLGLDMKVIEKQQGFVRLNLSRNSRIPAMNDRHWNPGGNKDLSNEYSCTGELSFDMNGKLSAGLGYDAELTAYAGKIKDLIQWLPGGSGYWSPRNLSETSVHGFETDLSLMYRTGPVTVKISGLYSYTRSQYSGSGSSRGNQLIYIPVNQINLSARATFGSYYAGIRSALTGRRFTTAENDEFLPSHWINDLSLGYRAGSGKNKFDISLRADNIFNVNYEVIAYYPVPGRSFQISVTYNLKR